MEWEICEVFKQHQRKEQHKETALGRAVDRVYNRTAAVGTRHVLITQAAV